MSWLRWLGLGLVLAGQAGTLLATREEVCSDRTPESPLGRLRKDIFKHYDLNAGPRAKANELTEFIPFVTRYSMNMDESTSTINLFGYLILMWEDHQLSWAPSEYGNVSRMYALDSEIWTPIVADLGGKQKNLPPAEVMVKNGTVVWTLRTPLRGRCESDPYRWPKDTSVCRTSVLIMNHRTARLGSTSHLKWWRNAVVPKTWKLTEVTPQSSVLENLADKLTLTMRFQRVSAMRWMAAVTPWPALGLLLLTACCMPADSSLRPTVLFIVLTLCFTTKGMQVIGSFHPPHGVTPVLILLQRVVLVLAAVAVPEWVLVLHLGQRKGKGLVAGLLPGLLVDRLFRAAVAVTLFVIFLVGVSVLSD